MSVALVALRRARRRNRLANIDWFDRFYNAYATALIAGFGAWFVSDWVTTFDVGAAAITDVAEVGPAAVGLLAAAAITAGLRSGARGGPLNLEAATVHHELLSPVPKAAVLRGPAVRLLRHACFASAVAGASAGLLAHRALGTPAVSSIIGAAASGAAIGVAAVAAALVAAGARLPTAVPTLTGGALIALAAWDLASDAAVAPTSPFGAVALWPLAGEPLDLLVLAVVAALAVIGVRLLEGTSVEAARRRSGLVQELRFAVTMQDFRTVVLLRRRLAGDRLRNRPWVTLSPGTLRSPSRRALRSLLRLPAGRFLRILTLGAAAGAALTLAADAPVVIIAAGAMLLLAGLDAVEPLAQEIDHPQLWAGHPVSPGLLLLRLLPPCLAAMVPAALLAAAMIAMLDTPDAGVLMLAATLGCAGATVGAAVGSAMGPVDVVALWQRVVVPEAVGSALVQRAVTPFLLAAIGLAPALAVYPWEQPGTQGPTVGAATLVAVGVNVGAAAWLVRRRPARG